MQTDTVFILGAGASNYYGFPLGPRLLREVCGICRSSPELLREHGFDPSEIQEFGEYLAETAYGSVDAFVEKSPDFMPIAKTAIAAVLIPYEVPRKLFPGPEPPNHWYQALFQALWSEEDQSLVTGNKLTILTFNYDRSLEFFLRQVASRRTSRSSGAATMEIVGPFRIQAAEGPTIIHLHGELGDLVGTSDVSPYSDDRSVEAVSRAAGKLHLLPEADTSSMEFDLARSAIHNAKRIVFLGFGFHPKSVERLYDFSDDALMEGKIVTGTRAGFTDEYWEHEVKSKLLTRRWTDGRDIHFLHQFLTHFDLHG